MKQHLVILSLLSLACIPAAWAQSQESGVVATAKTVATKVEQAVERGAKAAASGVERGAKAAAHGVQVGVKAAAEGVEKGAKATARAAGTVADKVKPSSP